MKSKTYLIFPKVLKGQEADDYVFYHRYDPCLVFPESQEKVEGIKQLEPLEEIDYI